MIQCSRAPVTVFRDHEAGDDNLPVAESLWALREDAVKQVLRKACVKFEHVPAGDGMIDLDEYDTEAAQARRAIEAEKTGELAVIGHSDDREELLSGLGRPASSTPETKMLDTSDTGPNSSIRVSLSKREAPASNSEQFNPRPLSFGISWIFQMLMFCFYYILVSPGLILVVLDIPSDSASSKDLIAFLIKASSPLVLEAESRHLGGTQWTCRVFGTLSS